MIRPSATALAALSLAILGSISPAAGGADTPRPGGVLNLTLREDLPQGFSIHETSTISTVWPAMPCLSNLVLFDPLKPIESPDTIIGELAEKWSWQDNYRNLVFFLRKGVKWHDGQPFTAQDVKYTFDMVREAPDAQAKLRISPRKDWYANVEAIEVADFHTVVFRLKRPQPSLILMLASGYSPIYAAHLPVATYRTGCVGTGPFKLKEWRKGEFVELVRNPEYFVKGRPYLDALRYTVIAERGTRVAALQTGKVDVPFPTEASKTIAEQLKKAVPQLVVTVAAQNVSDNVIMNEKKPPFDNPKVRLAVSHAIDRRGLISALYQGGAIGGAAMLSKPYGVWALPDRELATLPGSGKPADEKAKARKLMAEVGYSPDKPLRVEMVTRAIAIYVDLAAFLINELKQVGIEATLKPVETAQWHAMATRGEYQIGANLTGIGPDDPDANFYENFACGSPRNYSFYCDEQVMQRIAQQSRELDPQKRLALVQSIQRKLEEDAARPLLAWRVDYWTVWPPVKNFVPHQSVYNWGRLQEVWLDK